MIEGAPRQMSKPPASSIAACLINEIQNSDRPLVYVALGETAADKIARAVRCLDPELELIHLPPWDCLPYDRVPPSRQSMGRRMDALRDFVKPSAKARLLVTSLDAVLQRVPPLPIIENSWFEVAIGDVFDRAAFESFVRCTGYMEDGIVDEPGELAFRDDVVDIFPAGASIPMRIVLAENGTIAELRSYDPLTQRTTNIAQTMVFGPASEAVVPEGINSDMQQSDISEHGLLQLYETMPTVFDVMGNAAIAFAEGTGERLDSYLDIIDDARQARRRFDGQEANARYSLYLGRSAWNRAVDDLPSFNLDLASAEKLPPFLEFSNPRKAFIDFATSKARSGHTVLLAGSGQAFNSLCRRLERETEAQITAVERWRDVEARNPGSFLKMACALDQGFVAQARVVVSVNDIVGNLVEATDFTTQLCEPELQLGDVIVHEDHGIGVLDKLERVTVDAITRDAARLRYRDGASILVAMDEFGKLWRYGSHAEAVTLDRLQTEAWSKRRAAIDKDIRRAARHMLRLAKERKDVEAKAFIPPPADYAKFVRRFPYSETGHQAAAIEAVLADLARGTVMNRLVCGDVGFGKTEVALRAAAAVALAGGQVVVIAPTTVLVRQHFATFERRFAGTGVDVAMLSRVVDPTEAKKVKAGLATGKIGIVVATQAILAKDIRFSHLSLLVVDEEHRFGTREKQAMRGMAPLLHMLTMSATPIPRTLQAALIGVQDVSLLATAPSKRRPVRTSVGSLDRASMRTALMREHRRGGQSFLVVPQIDDIDQVKVMLDEIVPELCVRVAHGKMKAAVMDDIMVHFADGDGDLLLSTNIIESGLDVQRANTIFVWRADRFGLAQLHQLRGRVGRGKAQGVAYLLTRNGDAISEETELRLSTIVENDRLGAGLAISVQDLDLRGAGDIAGEDQAGHMKLIGVSLYQKLLERAVAGARNEASVAEQAATLNLGIVGAIPAHYVSEETVRLNLYIRLLRIGTESGIDELAEEFEDRFGDLPSDVSVLLRLAKLRIAASRLGISKLDAGPRAMAISFATKTTRRVIKLLSRKYEAMERDDRLVFEPGGETGLGRIAFFEEIFAGAFEEAD